MKEKIEDCVLCCPKCQLKAKIIDCMIEYEITPNDDDGNLCCPRCWYVLKNKVIMNQPDWRMKMSEIVLAIEKWKEEDIEWSYEASGCLIDLERLINGIMHKQNQIIDHLNSKIN